MGTRKTNEESADEFPGFAVQPNSAYIVAGQIEAIASNYQLYNIGEKVRNDLNDNDEVIDSEKFHDLIAATVEATINEKVENCEGVIAQVYPFLRHLKCAIISLRFEPFGKTIQMLEKKMDSLKSTGDTGVVPLAVIRKRLEHILENLI